MSNINDKYRPELKSYFIAYAIPTQQNFEDFIDAMIIQGEDPIAVTPESPLMVKVSGDDHTREEFIRFYEEFEQNHYWSLAQNPEGAPDGFEIAASKIPRLFIQKDNAFIGINTINPKGQLDVRIANNNDDIAPLVIGQDQVNYLSVSSLKDNAKVIIGRQSGDFTGNEAKLHVTLDDDNVGDDVYPLMIENATDSNEYFFIRNNGQVGINADEDYLDSDSDTILNVHGNIKAGLQTDPFYLKNSGSNQDPTLISTIADNWLKIISNSSLGFWANSGEPTDRENPDLHIEAHKVGIGTTAANAKLAVNGSLYIGSNDGSHNPDNKLDVGGDTKISGNVLITGSGKTLTVADNLVVNRSSISAGSDNLLLEAKAAGAGVNIYDTDTMLVTDHNVRIGQSNDAQLHLNGGLYVPDYRSGDYRVDFKKLEKMTTVVFETVTISIEGNKSATENRTDTVSFSPNKIKKAEAMLKGYQLKFVGSNTEEENKVHEVRADVSGISIINNDEDVQVTVSARLASNSSPSKGEKWKGFIKVVVIAEVAS